MPARSLIPQYATGTPSVADPYYGEYSALAQQYLKNKYPPVYSAGQGLAEVLGDVGKSYFEKQGLEKAQAQQSNDYSDLAQAMVMAGNSNQFKDPGTGAVLDPANFQSPIFDQSKLQGSPTTAQDRYQAAISSLANTNPRMAVQSAPALQQMAQASQPPPAVPYKTAPGETTIFLNPVTGRPYPTGGSGAPPDSISGGPQLTPFAQNLVARGVKVGSPEFNAALKAEQDKQTQPEVTWRPATPAEKHANGISAATNAQISNRGELKTLPKEPGQVGPAYDAQTGAPIGVVDYTEPATAQKLQTGQILPREPKVLASDDVKQLTSIGNDVQELNRLMGSYKPEYSRIIGSSSPLRGFLGGKSYNEGPDWFNQAQAVFLKGTKDIAGRSPQLIDEYNRNRPEPTDAPNVVIDKMNNIIRLRTQEGVNLAGTFKKGGYLGQQVDQALGFDPAMASNPGNTPQNNARGNTFGGGNDNALLDKYAPRH